MGVRGEELGTARIYNFFFEEFCYKGKERNEGRDKLKEEGGSRQFLLLFL